MDITPDRIKGNNRANTPIPTSSNANNLRWFLYLSTSFPKYSEPRDNPAMKEEITVATAKAVTPNTRSSSRAQTTWYIRELTPDKKNSINRFRRIIII